MIRNYIKIAWRNLFKQKLYSFINIGGLTTGLTCFILIFLYATHEFSYDKYYGNHKNIYRVIQQQPGNEYLGTDYFAVMPSPLAKAMEEEFPEVVNATSFVFSSSLIKIKGQNYLEENGVKAESNFFKVLSSPFLSGNPETALNKRNGIVLNKSLSEKIFGSTDILGQTLELDGNNFEVTGVMADLPDNLSFSYDFVRSKESEEEYLAKNWENNNPYVFMVLADGARPEVLESKFPSLLTKYQKPESGGQNKYFIETLGDVHFSSNINNDVGKKGNSTFLYLLIFIACVILLLAAINYMNLSIARSVKRNIEVGLRKIVGAKRSQILLQFLGESVLFTFLALVLALALSYMLLPLFSELIERNLEFNLLTNFSYILSMVVLLLLVGVTSGSYPAVIISSLEPINILKGTVPVGKSRFKLQKVLIVGQYMASFLLVIGGILVYQQMQFVQNKKLGYAKDHIITVPIKDWSLREDIDALKTEWQSNSNIMSISSMDDLPTHIGSSTVINNDDNNDANDLRVYLTRVDYNYLDVFELELLAGRNFSKEFETDEESGYILNETGAKALGWTAEEAIGKQFTHRGTETIIGVVKDFNMHSMHMEIEPLMISLGNFSLNVALKVNPTKIPETLASLEASYANFSQYPFEYYFLDDKFDELYKADFRLGKAVNYFSLIAILLASFGLFGLAAIVTEQKTKEIGIRKVLGASEQKIIRLLTSDFLKTVLLAFLLATPVSWFLMHEWLSDFAYRIDISWKIYAFTALGAIIITIFTVGFQAIKAATVNPIKSLKTE